MYLSFEYACTEKTITIVYLTFYLIVVVREARKTDIMQ